MNRDNAIVAIRPQIPNLDVDAEGSEVLHFQNTILRQIIKYPTRSLSLLYPNDSSISEKT